MTDSSDYVTLQGRDNKTPMLDKTLVMILGKSQNGTVYVESDLRNELFLPLLKKDHSVWPSFMSWSNNRLRGYID
ncbi:hypothetical protein Tco_0835846 [Tanacetum coccineum]